jgi:membrane protein DedA with SNARE-associated domain
MANHILDILRDLLAQYGYIVVAITLLLENSGLPVPGETVLLLASFLAYSEHSLSLEWIIPIGIVAATVGDNIGFYLGHRGGRPLLNRYQKMFRVRDEIVERGERLFAHYGPATIFFARFIFGLRVIAGPLAGVLRMPWKKFAIFNFLGASLWVTVISLAGYFFGSEWDTLLHYMKRFNFILASIFVLALLVVWWRKRRAAMRK